MSIKELVIQEVQSIFSNLLAIYAFGSRVQGTANAQSDLDLAVLVEGYADPVVFLLAQAGWIEPALAEDLKRMVGFRNIALHDYQTMQLPITVRIITFHLDEFLRYSQRLLTRGTKVT